ncbi:MAG: hypothetical protein EOO73_07200 [Myxococcales bacterium]|nr:MAG: hypothetical protein EOO73_07200 [Myxococcales bacterium]
MKRVAFGAALLALACGESSKEPSVDRSGAAGESSLGGAQLGGAFSGGAGGAGGSTSSGGAGGSAGERELPAMGGSAGSSGSSGTAGAAGACSSRSKELTAWPGSASVVTLEPEGDFESDLSGLTYESPGVMWAVNNLSSKLFRLVKTGGRYERDLNDDWASGKGLRFPGGQGAPDAEGVTLGATSGSGVYVSSERNLNEAEASRLSVLRYDVSAASTTLTATHEWNVTALLPDVDPNSGLEAITWVADAWLTAHGFLDDASGKLYQPSDYGEHGGGMFVVGVEQTGALYGLALNHTTGSATLLTTIAAPLEGVMGLEMDRDSGELWAYCDDTCGNQAAVLALAESGHFELTRRFSAPSGLPDSNNEGIALAPDSECSGGLKPFFWADDADAGGFSLRQGALSCGCR